MGAEDIAARVRDLEEERFRLKFRSATEPLEEPLRLRLIRKDIARLKTIASEREQGIVREAKSSAPATKKGKAKKSTARRPAKKGAAKTRAR
jgi:large subunit ribosomal protein L29